MNESATLDRGQEYSERSNVVARIRALGAQVAALKKSAEADIEHAAAIQREIKALQRQAGIET